MISNAQIFQSPSTQDPASTFQITASFPGVNNILNVALTAQTIVPGQVVTGVQMPYGATVLAYGTQGTTGVGGIGTYALSVFSENVNSETMTVTLSPLGQAGQGSLWYQTDTTLLFNRNTANTGWTLVGPVNVNYLGLLPRAGGILTAPITGSTGLMTKDGITPFGGVPYVNSKNSLAATLADLAEAQTNLEEQIAAGVSTSISAIAIPSLNANIVIVFGTIGVYGGGGSIPAAYTIPITGLTYGDGTLVKSSECHGFASIQKIDEGTSGQTYLLPQNSNGTTWICYSVEGPTFGYGAMNYLLIAIKSGA